MKRLTLVQRERIRKTLTLAVSLLVFAASFAAIPYIVSVIPPVTAKGMHINDPNAPVGSGFTLGSGEAPSGNNSDTQAEESTPGTESAESEPPAADESSAAPTPTRGENDKSVFASNLCWYDKADQATLNIINHTKFNVDLNKFLAQNVNISAKNDGVSPLVLIVHTHGSESYLPAGVDFYAEDESFRSETYENTVVNVGDVLAERLNALGIPTVHDRTMYDTTDFNKSYTFSRAGVKKMLEKYPTISFVIDLHRDSIFDAKGNNIKPLTVTDGEECAQIMLVVGTNEAGASHPGWRDNLTFATHLQQSLNTRYPTLARPINLRSAAFNQALSKGSLLIEVGACGNTIEEAKNAILRFADVYAAEIGKLT